MTINPKVPTIASQQFFRDVLEYLRRQPKQLPSKYFYDATGDRLFQEIMQLPEYYLTRCETEILVTHADTLTDLIKGDGPFNLVELGAGDCTKTIHLLRSLLASGTDFTFYPVDISGDAIRDLETRLPKELPNLQLAGFQGEYFPMLERAVGQNSHRNIVLFLGSNIGNMLLTEALEFCRQLRNRLRTGDKAIIGFDLKKAPSVIRAAYDDQAGVTRQFNLNLLTRINRELGGDFNIDAFDHYCSYDPASGACKSYLISLADQVVHVADQVVVFRKDEYIWTEVSQKYSIDQVEQIAAACGFQSNGHFFDSKCWFADTVWTAI